MKKSPRSTLRRDMAAAVPGTCLLVTPFLMQHVPAQSLVVAVPVFGMFLFLLAAASVVGWLATRHARGLGLLAAGAFNFAAVVVTLLETRVL